MHPLTLPEAALRVLPNVVLFDGGRYLIGAGSFGLLLSLLLRSRWATRKIQARHATGADVARELANSARSVLVYAALFTPVLWAKSQGLVAPALTGASGWVVAAFVAVLLVGHDTWFYWMHRLLHDPARFARWHRTHHRSVTPTPFAAYSFSWREAVAEAMFFALWQMLVPTPWLAMFIVLGLSILRNAWGHLGVELHPVWWVDHPLTRWMTTTTHHDLHHAGRFDRNLGLYFTWWDRLMGTEHPRYREIFREIAGRPLAHRRPAVA